MDSNPSGPLDEYYPFEEKDRATYMLFNPDDLFVERNAEESIFKQFVE